MPLYEYTCRACARLFEALVLPGKDLPACPACGGGQLERSISSFAVSTPTTRQHNLKAGRARQAKTQRDKDIADHEAIEHHDH